MLEKRNSSLPVLCNRYFLVRSCETLAAMKCQLRSSAVGILKNKCEVHTVIRKSLSDKQLGLTGNNVY